MCFDIWVDETFFIVDNYMPAGSSYKRSRLIFLFFSLSGYSNILRGYRDLVFQKERGKISPNRPTQISWQILLILFFVWRTITYVYVCIVRVCSCVVSRPYPAEVVFLSLYLLLHKNLHIYGEAFIWLSLSLAPPWIAAEWSRETAAAAAAAAKNPFSLP